MIRHAVWIEADQTDPYVNLAIEQQLMRRLPADTAVLYLWQNDRTIVIGRNQDPWMECHVEAFMAEGGRIARRLSGGGAVYHDLGNLNFTWVVPPVCFDISRQMHIVLEAVRALGLQPVISGRNDLVIDGRKFSGNAFQVQKNAACHHGTLLIHSDKAAMGRWLTADRSKLACNGVQSVASRIVNLRELCLDASLSSVKRELLRAFSKAYDLKLERFSLEELDWVDIQKEAAKLASTDWLFPKAEMPASIEGQRRFEWGSLRIRIWLENGRIRRTSLHTDALETRMFLAAENVLCHIPWESGEIKIQMGKLFVRGLTVTQKKMVQDMINWLHELSS